MRTDVPRESIAIVGAGVSGLVAAHLLNPHAEVTLFEADARIGGHVNTVDVHEPTQTLAIDTGFIVYNERNYAGFSALLRELQVDTQPSEMSFSYGTSATGLEYRGTNLNSLLAKRTNIFRPSFLKMAADIPRFNRHARRLLGESDLSLTLREFLQRGRYSKAFIDHYLIPIGASIWSADPQTFADFPAAPLARFFDQHGLISLGKRPQWRTVTGGARRYVEAIATPLGERVRTRCAVQRIERGDAGVVLYHDNSHVGERFDRVVLATHADTALKMIEDPTDAERSVLGAFQFQANRATLHTDAGLLPKHPRSWASWNYRRLADDQRVPALTYYANRLQNLESSVDYCITLNSDEAIDPSCIIASFDYSHPVFNEAALRAQLRHHEIDGARRTHFAGAYWGYGFHEDGFQSAWRVAQRIQGRSVVFEATAAP